MSAVALLRVQRRAAGQGFTLVELMVVMAVLAVLAAAVMPLAEMQVQRDRERELKQALWQIRDAIDAYHQVAKQGTNAGGAARLPYPPNLAALVDGLPNPQRPGEQLRFLRRVPRDPFAEASLPAEETWQLRSYASAPERPEPGVDVYDVASRSAKVGLNGVPLKDW